MFLFSPNPEVYEPLPASVLYQIDDQLRGSLNPYRMDPILNLYPELDVQSKQLVKKYMTNPVYRVAFAQYRQKILETVLTEIEAAGGKLPPDLVKIEISDNEKFEDENGRRFIRHKVTIAVKGQKNVVINDIDIGFDTAKYDRISRSTTLRMGRETIRGLPLETAGFAMVMQALSYANILYDPVSNPVLVEQTAGAFVNDKFPYVDLYELSKFGGLMFNARLANHVLNQGLYATRWPEDKLSFKLATHLNGYSALALAMFTTEVVADLGMTVWNCARSYYNVKLGEELDIYEKLAMSADCQIAYKRFVSGRLFEKYFAMGISIGIAGAVAGGSSQMLAWLTKTTGGGIKAVANTTKAGSKIIHIVTSGANLIPHPAVRGMAWVGRIGMFLTWAGIIEPFIMKPTTSMTLSNHIDSAEDKIFAAMEEFSQKNWVLSKPHNEEECKDVPRMARSYLIKVDDLAVCYKGTLIEFLDDFYDLQQEWREFILEDMNMSYSAWVEYISKLLDKYRGAKTFYSELISQIKNKSSLIFDEDNPLRGLPGLDVKDNEIVHVEANGSLSADDLRLLQKRNLLVHADALDRLVKDWPFPQQDEYWRALAGLRELFKSQDLKSAREGLDYVRTQMNAMGSHCAKLGDRAIVDFDFQEIKGLTVENLPCLFATFYITMGLDKMELFTARSNMEQFMSEVQAKLIEMHVRPEIIENIGPSSDSVTTTMMADHFLVSTICGKELTDRPKTPLQTIKDFFTEGPASAVGRVFGPGTSLDFSPPRIVDLPRKKFCHPAVDGVNFFGRLEFVPRDIYAGDYLGNVVRHIYPEVLEDFEDWWLNYVEIDYQKAVDAAEREYQKIIHEKFKPAIYGNTAQVRFLTREQARGFFDADRRNHIPVIVAVKLEMELYLDSILRPIWLSTSMPAQEFQSQRDRLIEAVLAFLQDRDGQFMSAKNIKGQIKEFEDALNDLSVSLNEKSLSIDQALVVEAVTDKIAALANDVSKYHRMVADIDFAGN